MAEPMKQHYFSFAQDSDSARMEVQWREDAHTEISRDSECAALRSPSAIYSAAATFRQVYYHGVGTHRHDFQFSTHSWGHMLPDIKRERIKPSYEANMSIRRREGTGPWHGDFAGETKVLPWRHALQFLGREHAALRSTRQPREAGRLDWLSSCPWAAL